MCLLGDGSDPVLSKLPGTSMHTSNIKSSAPMEFSLDLRFVLEQPALLHI
jgi:hypothetical protein